MKDKQIKTNSKINEEKLNPSGLGIVAYVMSLLIPVWGLILGVIDLVHWKDGRDHSIGLIGLIVSIAMVAVTVYCVSIFVM